MISSVVLTSLLSQKNLNSRQYLELHPKILLSGQFYDTTSQPYTNSPIIINVLSGTGTRLYLNNTQRYLNLSQLSAAFTYSSNITDTDYTKSIVLESKYSVSNNKIKIDSREDLLIPFSAYVTKKSSNKKYFLVKADAYISAYIINGNFIHDNFNYYIPIKENFNYDLSNNFEYSINTFTEDLISSYFETQNLKYSQLIHLNNLSGKLYTTNANTIKNKLTQTNNYIESYILSANYKNYQLNKIYNITSTLINLYFIDVELTKNYKWISSDQLTELYYNSINAKEINLDIIKYYGCKNLQTKSYLTIDNLYSYSENTYNIINNFQNASKLDATIKTKINDNELYSNNCSMYVYQYPIFQNNKKIYYIINSKTNIPSAQFIDSFYSTNGNTINLKIDNAKTDKITLNNIDQTHIIQYFVSSIKDGNQFKITSSYVYTYPISATYQSTIGYITDDNYVSLSGFRTSNKKVYLEYLSSNLDIIDESIKKYNYYQTINLLLDIQKSLNTYSTNIAYNVYYQDNENLLSTILYPVKKYGQLCSSCYDGYNIITTTNKLYGKDFIHTKYENILDCNSAININLQNVTIQSEPKLSWIKSNYIKPSSQIVSSNYDNYSDFYSMIENQLFYNFAFIQLTERIVNTGQLSSIYISNYKEYKQTLNNFNSNISEFVSATINVSEKTANGIENISGQVTDYNIYIDFIQSIKNGAEYIFDVVDAFTQKCKKYYIYPKSLIRFPGQKKFVIKFNNSSNSISSIEQFNNLIFYVNDEDTLQFQNNIINFKTYNLTLNCNKNYSISGNTIQQLSSQIQQNYINTIKQTTDCKIITKYFSNQNDISNYNFTQYGQYYSKVNFQPKQKKYENTINLINDYSIICDYTPEKYELSNQVQNGCIYYGKEKLVHYAKIRLAQYTGIKSVDLTQAFLNTKFGDFTVNKTFDSSLITLNKVSKTIDISSNIYNKLPIRLYFDSKQDYINSILEIVKE